MSERQNWIGDLVGSLPDDVPSMTWRSDLNERIRAEAVRVRRRRTLRFVLAPSLTCALSACVAFVIWTGNPAPVRPSNDNGIEAALVATHQQGVTQVADAGLTFSEAESYADSIPNRETWTDNDLEGI